MSRLFDTFVPVLVLVLLSVGLKSCHRKESDHGKIQIYAAASLQSVLEKQKKQIPDDLRSKIRIVTAGSQVVARQVARGAKADIVFLASSRWMDYVERKEKLKQGSRRALLGNRLVLITSNNTAPLSSFEELARYQGTLALGNPSSVPAGIYAKQALSAADLWSRIHERIVSFPHVRAALSAVSSGEIPLGITYRTDVSRGSSVQVIDRIPEKYTPNITYPIALTKSHDPEARRIFADLTGKTASGIYEKYGFVVKEKGK